MPACLVSGLNMFLSWDNLGGMCIQLGCVVFFQLCSFENSAPFVLRKSSWRSWDLASTTSFMDLRGGGMHLIWLSLPHLWLRPFWTAVCGWCLFQCLLIWYVFVEFSRGEHGCGWSKKRMQQKYVFSGRTFWPRPWNPAQLIPATFGLCVSCALLVLCVVCAWCVWCALLVPCDPSFLRSWATWIRATNKRKTNPQNHDKHVSFCDQIRKGRPWNEWMSRIQCVSKPLCASLNQVHFGRWFGHWFLGKNCSLLVQTCDSCDDKIRYSLPWNTRCFWCSFFTALPLSLLNWTLDWIQLL